MIRERGVGRLSLRELARRVGVSHGASANHFRNKAELLSAFAAQGYDLMAREVMKALAPKPLDGRDTLETIGRSYVRFALKNREHFAVMFRPELLDPKTPGLRASSDRAFDLLRATLQRCAAEGRLGDRNPEHVAVAAWSLSHGMASLWISERIAARTTDRNAERVSAEVHRLFVRSIMPD